MKYFLILVTIACIWGGGQGVYTYIKNQEPTEYNLPTIGNQNIPKEQWLVLTNCNFNLMESVYFESSLGDGLADELYTPLHNQNDSIVAFIYQQTQGVLDLYNLVSTQTEEDKFMHFVEKYKEQISQEGITYSGLVRYGIDLDNDEWRQLSGVSSLVVDNFIILDYNTEPSAGFSFFMIGFGLLFLYLSIKSFIKKGTPEQEA